MPDCSTRWLVGLLHPTADHEVHRVAASPRWLRVRCFPSGASPSRAFPTRKAVPASPLAAALLPLSSASRVSRGRRDFRALLLASVRCRTPPLPVALTRCSPGLPFSGASCPSLDLPRELRPEHHPVVPVPASSRRGCASRHEVLQRSTGGSTPSAPLRCFRPRCPVTVRRGPRTLRASSVLTPDGPCWGPEDHQAPHRLPKGRSGGHATLATGPRTS